MSGINLSKKDARKLQETVRRVDRILEGGARRNSRPFAGGDEAWVTITSETQVAGRYPGTRWDYDATADTWTEANDVWVVTLNDATLSLGTTYQARIVGVADDELVIMQVDGGNGGGDNQINIQTGQSLYTLTQIDALPVAISTLYADEDVGLFFAQETTTNAYFISCDFATESLPGLVETGPQRLGTGQKTVGSLGVGWESGPGRAVGYIDDTAYGNGRWLTLGCKHYNTSAAAWLEIQEGQNYEAGCELKGIDYLGNYVNPNYAITDDTNNTFFGIWGTLTDGTVVKGGLVTNAGAGDFNFGTF
jgi:hypothetical protein